MKFQDEYFNHNNIVRTDKKTRTVYFVSGELVFKTAAEFEDFVRAIFDHEKHLTMRGVPL